MKKKANLSLTKELSSFSLPLLASSLLQLLIGQISFAIVSRLSSSTLSSVNTIDSLLFSVGGILGVLSVAFNMLGSKALGQKDKKSFYQYISSITVLNTIVGFGVIALIVLFGNTFLHQIYGFTGELQEIASIYLLSMSPYILLTLYSFTLTNILKVEKKTMYIFTISLASSILQLFLSYTFINGLFIFPKMGVVGAGLSLNISMLFTLFVYTFLVKDQIKLAILEKPIYIKNLLKKGFPLLGQEILEGVIFIIVFEAIIARSGKLNLASYALIAQGLTIIKLPTFMFANAVTVFVSEAYGERKMKKIGKITKLSFLLSLLGYCLFSCIIYFAKEPFLSFFSTDSAVLNLATEKLPILFLFSISTVGYEISKYSLQSTEHEKYVIKTTFLVNAFCIFGMVMISLQKMLTLDSIFFLYFINFFVLSVFFTKKLNRDNYVLKNI